MNKYRYSELHGKIIAKYGTIASYAQALGINPNSVANKLSGKTPWKTREILLTCDLLEIDRKKMNIYFLL